MRMIVGTRTRCDVDVAEAQAADSEERVLETIKRDGRDPLTGRFLA